MLKVNDMSVTSSFLNPVQFKKANPSKADALRACEMMRSNRSMVMSLDGSLEYACDNFGWVTTWFEGVEVATAQYDEFVARFVEGF